MPPSRYANARCEFRIIGTFASRGTSEFERTLILSRTREGRVRAKAKGQSLGRKFKLTVFQQQEAKTRIANGEFQTDVAATYGVHPSTMSRLAKR